MGLYKGETQISVAPLALRSRDKNKHFENIQHKKFYIFKEEMLNFILGAFIILCVASRYINFNVNKGIKL